MLIYVEPQDCLSKRAIVERGNTPTYIATYRSCSHRYESSIHGSFFSWKLVDSALLRCKGKNSYKLLHRGLWILMETAGIGIEDSIPFHVMFGCEMDEIQFYVQIRQMLEKLLKRERAEVETRLSRQVEEAGAQQDRLCAYIYEIMFRNVLFLHLLQITMYLPY
ncbi:hypothetical protein LXL04_038780 [Taraxacum kok-saghyz]